MFGRKRVSILAYWSIRYFSILFVSMLMVGGTFLVGIHTYAERSQQTSLLRIIDDIVHAAAERNGMLPEGGELQRWLDDKTIEYGLPDRPMMVLFDREGEIVQKFPQVLPLEPGTLASHRTAILSGEPEFIELASDRPETLLAVTAPIVHQSETIGHAMYLVRENNVLEGFLAFSFPRMIGWMTLMACGWTIIFLMIRRLVKPIQEVSAAAKQVVEGHYQVSLAKTYKEREIHDLMTSFQEMAEQLRQLEGLRAQLLAGVTHELKTPITAINGLAQAIQDRVVVGEEADQFLKYCIMECNRLKGMVDDLLDFNSFAANAIQVNLRRYSLKDAVCHVVEMWQLTQEDAFFDVSIQMEEDDDRWTILTDIERLKQIIINLLNNARDALEAEGAINVRLTSESDRFRIQVEDTGRGIPEEEHSHIFEPFYRGGEKKTKVRGLGIGLPFSRLIAHSLGGQLVLDRSTPAGTCFSLYLPKGEMKIQVVSLS